MGELRDWQAEEIKELSERIAEQDAEIATLKAASATLQAENATLREDQKRLEWCASNQAEIYRDEPYWLIRWIDPQGDWMAEMETSMATDWRDAIDRAMHRDTAGGE